MKLNGGITSNLVDYDSTSLQLNNSDCRLLLIRHTLSQEMPGTRIALTTFSS
jgi:hypothetical protein